MSELIKTLHKKGDASVEIYPNIKPANIPASAINTSKLEDDSVTSTKITDGAITNAKIANGAISSSKLGTNSVGNLNIQDGSIGNTKLAFHIYQHTYYLRVGDNTANVEFMFTDITPISNPISDIDELFEEIKTSMPTTFTSYIKNKGFTPNANDRTLYFYDSGSDIWQFEVMDNGDESVTFYASTLNILQTNTKQLF